MEKEYKGLSNSTSTSFLEGEGSRDDPSDLGDELQVVNELRHLLVELLLPVDLNAYSEGPPSNSFKVDGLSRFIVVF